MSKRISLPSFLKELVDESPYNHVVHEAIRHFSEWYKASTLPFFPDYTDHGVDHLEEVMTTVEALITPAAKDHFSNADAVALVLAVLLHDSALHLSKEGFWELIKGQYEPNYIKPFDKQGWQQTWDDFFFFARRWDDNKLINVFGSNAGSGPKAQVRDPFDHWDNLEESDRLLIGEFIRQHHPRLAHEMAVHGIPGNKGPAFTLNHELPSEWRNIVGLIARSHGLPLRPCVDYLGKEFGHVAKREYQNIHAIYLMALLRIADYIQIQPSRTSTLVFKYKGISSRISELEHKAHQAVRNITDKGDDPESIHIDAHPAEAAVFLRLKEWLAGIQSELDSSWAVLGEVYGLQPDLRNLGLLFRRVRSNLDDVANFATKVSYVPDRIRFDVARAELLKLLIGPLYGDDPSYGVRELMQNSIDAVREYEQFVKDHPEYATVPRREQEADVVIDLSALDETGHAIMTISDCGIGMKEEVIRDYFLRAGASYRQSSQWKATFESDEANISKSKVLRSGRFGVGALAVFLIGDELTVETRHVLSEEGYHFSTSLDTEIINIQRSKNIPIGTKITTTVNTVNYNKLLKSNDLVKRPSYWDWYCFDQPTVIRRFYHPKNGQTICNQHYELKENFTKIEWNKLETKEPYEIYWSHQKSPNLTCNGMFISNASSLKNILLENLPRPNGSYTSISLPNIAIIDHNGNFPLNLQRDGLRISHYPFIMDLVEDVFSEMFAWLLFNGPHDITSSQIASISLSPWLTSGTAVNTIVACASGFGIRCATLLNEVKVRRVIIYNDPDLIINNINEDAVIFAGDIDYSHYDSLVNFSITHKTLKSNKQSQYLFRCCMLENDYKRIIKPKIINTQDGEIEEKEGLEYNLEERTGPWVTISSSSCPEKGFNVHKYPASGINNKFIRRTYIIEERFYECNSMIQVSSNPWLIDEVWLNLFGNNWIPFNIEDRLNKFQKTAKHLAKKYPHTIRDEHIYQLLK